ncbi:MAG: exodeoxyribonuclease VII large subunit [Mariprofundaceae bacterium]|nr:exodeoxyribonuclease VII large subunit [Mariprofundaceae bacterium]
MNVQSVTELTASIKQVVEQGFAHIQVQGEVSRLTRPSSGHLYFTIKDSHAAISAVVWRSAAVRLHAQLKEGQAFIFSGHLSVYEPRGTYQMMVTRIMPVGAGALAAEFERRKALFAKRGWFSQEKKQVIPTLPKSIGIVTSATAAALQDVKKVLATRPAYLKITLFSCVVQGEQAPDSIVAAFHKIQAMSQRPDVILLVRGGGSMEDLWCFNDERVVQAVFDCDLPIISGVGHEIDTTLADYAADVRAATPSNAAELSCPSRDYLRQTLPSIARIKQMLEHRVSGLRQQCVMQEQRLSYQHDRIMDQRRYQHNYVIESLVIAMKTSLVNAQQRWQAWQTRLQKHEPSQQLREQSQRLHQCQVRLSQVGGRVMQRRQVWQAMVYRLQQSARKTYQIQSNQWLCMHEALKALDPQHVLQRGYSLIYNQQGHLLTQVEGLKEQDSLTIHWADGHVEAHIDNIYSGEGETK